jgi:hypothetical protein
MTIPTPFKEIVMFRFGILIAAAMAFAAASSAFVFVIPDAKDPAKPSLYSAMNSAMQTFRSTNRRDQAAVRDESGKDSPPQPKQPMR